MNEKLIFQYKNQEFFILYEYNRCYSFDYKEKKKKKENVDIYSITLLIQTK